MRANSRPIGVASLTFVDVLVLLYPPERVDELNPPPPPLEPPPLLPPPDVLGLPDGPRS